MSTLPLVTSVRLMKDYELEVAFTDGTVSTLDFRSRVMGRGGVFEPLQSVDFFEQVSVDHEAGTLVWPNGVDFCPGCALRQRDENAGFAIVELGKEISTECSQPEFERQAAIARATKNRRERNSRRLRFSNCMAG